MIQGYLSGCFSAIAAPTPLLKAGLVRMSHAMQTNSFKQGMETVLDGYARNAKRSCLLVHSQATQAIRAKNAKKLQLCCYGLKPAEKTLILDMFSADWSEPLTVLQHTCVAGCCKSDADFRRRLREALRLAFGNEFSTPLLYRWKHWEGAAAYVSRGTALHNMLPRIWSMIHNSEASDLLTMWDEDSADLSPAFKQKIRASKVQSLLSSGKAGVAWLRVVSMLFCCIPLAGSSGLWPL